MASSDTSDVLVDVLVSFEEEDRATAEDIAARLRDAGIKLLLTPSPWEPKWRERWHVSLYQTRVLLLLLGRGGTGVPEDAWPDVQNWIATRGGSLAPVFLAGGGEEQRAQLPEWARQGVWLSLRAESEREKTLDLIVQGLRNSLKQNQADSSNEDVGLPLASSGLSDHAREAIRRADAFRGTRERRALRMEHLLIGLYDADDGKARTLFDRSGLDRNRLTEILASVEGADVPDAAPYLPSAAALVLLSAEVTQALRHARQLAGAHTVFTRHLLRGALLVAESSVIKSLTSEITDRSALLDVGRYAEEDDRAAVGQVERQLRELAALEDPTKLEAAASESSQAQAVLEESIHLASASDQPTTKDSLGFEPYVDAIAKFLASEDTKPPLTLSIEGEWGSGKSSFMLMLEEALRSESKPSCLTLRFNAWRHDKEDALWAAFALEFLRRIRRQRPLLARWRGDFRLFFSRYHWWEGWGELVRVAAIWTTFLLVAGTLFVAFVERGPALLAEVLDDNTGGLIGFFGRLGGGVGALAVIAIAFLKIKDLFGSPLQIGLRKYLRSPNYQDRVAFVERFHEDFDRIVKAYAEDRKIYVFIDDLDRCEIPKAADLMQALNLLIADDPRLIFIVGMDREKVAAGLAVKYEKLLPYLMTQDTSASPDLSGPWPPPEPQGPQPSLEVATRRFGLEYGYSFLEKFIQLPFRVPAPQPDDLGRFLTTISPEPPSAETAVGNGRERATTATSAATPQPGGVGGTRAGGDRQSASPAPPRVAPEVAAARKERVRVKFGADSAAVRTVALMVAPALENNPRRLKQFVNLFRLKAYVANETGLFDELSGRAQLTFEQLAKFVAIGLAWPALLADLDEDATLLGRLEGAATKGLTLAAQDERAHRWAGRRRLNTLLRFGCVAEGGRGEEPARYGFADLSVDALLRVSPRVVRTPSPPASTPARPATAAEAEETSQAESRPDPDVLRAMDRWVRESPQDMVPRVSRAEALRVMGHLEPALQAYEETIRDFPKEPRARSGRADVLHAMGRLEEALQAYEETIRDFPEDAGARNGRAQVLRDMGRLVEALQAYEEMILHFPDDVAARNGRAEVLRTMGRLQEALQAYEETILVFPDDVVARNGRAEVLHTTGRLEEALQAYEETILHLPDDVVAQAGRAEVLRAMNRLEPALQAYEETIRDFPQSEVARVGRAEVLRAMGRLEPALQAYDETIRRFPQM